MISFNTKQAHNFRPNSSWNYSQAFHTEGGSRQFNTNFGARTASNSFTQSAQNQQKFTSTRGSIPNIVQLNQDLNKLKEQLRRLSNQQQDKLVFQQTRQTLIEKQPERPKSKLSSDSHLHFRKDFSSQALSYPLQPGLHSKNQAAKSTQGGSQLKLAHSQQFIATQTHENIPNNKSIAEQRVEPSKIVPIVNPNKRENQRWSNIANTQSRYQLLPSQEELNTLKQKISKLESLLQISRKENESLRGELKQIQELLKMKEGGIEKLQQERKESQGQLKRQIELQRAQHLQVVQKLYHGLDHSNKKPVQPLNAFDQSLKAHILKNQQLQKQLDDKSQQANSLLDQIHEQFKTIQDMKAQLDIQSLKISSDFKAKLQRLEITIRDKQNEILSLKRSLEAIDCRHRGSLKELQQKDDFILKYMVHRSKDGLQDEIKQFFSSYKSRFTTPATLQLFLREQEELQQLRRKLQPA